jgi:dipeptidyl aminopeptidase/acylaminoacyl peptidase
MSDRVVASPRDVVPAAPSADRRRDVTAEALIALPEMLAPSVSPDGRWVAWTWLGRDPVASVYVAPADGSHAPRRLTVGPLDAAVECWSADSRHLIVALTEGGDEKARLHLVPVEGGAAPRLLTDPAPDYYYIVGGDLHPNGRWLVYAANVGDDGRPMEATWIHRQDLETGARLALARPRGPADTRPRLNRPGTHVVYGRSDRHPAGQTLWLVDIEGERDEEILAFADTDRISATWSPDGGQLVVVHDTKDRARVGLWRLSDRRLQWLIDDAGRNVESARWPHGSDEILVGEATDAVPHFSLIDPLTGRERPFVEQLKPLAPVGNSLGSGRWVARHGHARQPVELVTFPAAAPEQATSIASLWKDTDLRPADLAPAENFRWRSVDGLEIQGWLYRAPGRARGAVVAVHGGPALRDEDEFDPLIQYLVARGFNVLAPNYRGSTGFGMAFQEAIKAQGWGGLEQEDIRTGALALLAAGLAEPGRIGITGLSYGGYSSWCAITRHPTELFAAAAPVCGMTDLVIDYEATRPDLRPMCHEYMGGSPAELPALYRERSPVHFVADIRGRLLIVQGLRDPNVTPENMRVVCRALDAAGKPYELLTFDDEGHGIYKPKNRRILHRRLADFFAGALADCVAPAS